MSEVNLLHRKPTCTVPAHRYDKAYFWSFIAVIILCWSPSNLLAYLAPLLCVAIFVLLSKNQMVMRNVILWFLFWGILISAYIVLSPGFVVHSAILSVLTYSSFLVVLAIPGQLIARQGLLNRMLVWARWIVIIEALVGITQGLYGFSRTGTFDSSNGDFVEGTIHLALAPELAFSNPMFAINMAFLLIAILPDLILRRKGFVAITLGSIALILASVMHVLIILAVAGIIAILLYWPISLRRRMTYLLMIGLIVAVALSFFALRRNFGIANSFARRLISGDSYRTQAVKRTVVDLPNDYPLVPIVGLGPGQFSSRAGLIGTGLYFGGPLNSRPLPFVPQGMSQAFEDYTLDLWLAKTRGRGTGSTHQPFLSWLSVYSEWGILVFVAIFIVVTFLLIRVRLVVHNYPQRILATSFGIGLLLTLFLGIQENYWEVPQAILVGLMILKIQYAILTSPDTRNKLGEYKL